MLGKLSVPGRPTNFDNSRARTYCVIGAGRGTFFLSSLFSCLSASFGDCSILIEIRLKSPLNPNQLTH